MTARSHSAAHAQTIHHSLLADRQPLGTLILDTLSSLATRVVAASRRGRDARMLSEMDDSLLRDIGIRRSEIEYALRHGRTF
jgi:uncharacterized protein YjiS (DUF1127 family)